MREFLQCRGSNTSWKGFFFSFHFLGWFRIFIVSVWKKNLNIGVMKKLCSLYEKNYVLYMRPSPSDKVIVLINFDE